jgi:hypothetical protein
MAQHLRDYPGSRGAGCLRSWHASVGLSDTEVNAPAPLLRLAIYEQACDWIELVADIEADRTDRRLVPQARSDRIPEIAE